MFRFTFILILLGAFCPQLFADSYSGSPPDQARMLVLCGLYNGSQPVLCPASTQTTPYYSKICSVAYPYTQYCGAGYQCSYGGTINGSGICVNAPSCAAGLVRSTSGQCIYPSCGTNGLRYDAVPRLCTSDSPENCTGLGAIHNPITGACFTPPICVLPYTLSDDQTICNPPKCAPNHSFNEAYRRCVAAPPTCTANQHLAYDSTNTPNCVNNPTCAGSQQVYGCATGADKVFSCGCLGPQDCPGKAQGERWGTVNGIAGCYGAQTGAKALPQPTPGQPPATNKPTPPDPAGPKAPPGLPDHDGKIPEPTPPASGTAPDSPQSPAAGSQGPAGSDGAPGKCSGGDCICSPYSLPGSGETACPNSGICPPELYSSTSGACTKSSGDCQTNFHYEYSSMQCIADGAGGSNAAKDTAPADEGLGQRLDKIIDNTKSAAASVSALDSLKNAQLTPTQDGDFGDSDQVALTAAKSKWDLKYLQVQNGINALMPQISSTGSDLPVYQFEVKGKTITVDFNKHQQVLLIMVAGLYFVTWLYAFSILLEK